MSFLSLCHFESLQKSLGSLKNLLNDWVQTLRRFNTIFSMFFLFIGVFVQEYAPNRRLFQF